MIPYGRQEITQDDIDAVVAVLKSDYLTQGPIVPNFEQLVADYCNVSHGVAVNSATSALHIACCALGLGEGDWLWTSPITFVASANCGLYCGAKVDFVDIDSKTYNICAEKLEEKLKEADKQGTLPKIVIPVHFAGQSCDMQRINKLSKQYGFKIIEDASHAIGGKYQNEPIGSCRYSDITIFSFHPVKIITTAEGGLALTNNADYAEKMSQLRSHGITRDPGQMTHPSEGPWYYQQLDLGFNYRMTELQAALGVSQMSSLDKFVSRRHQIARRYNRLLLDLPVALPLQRSDCYSSFHLYAVCLQLKKIDVSHREVFESMRAQDVGVNLHYIPVHTQPYYQRMGFKAGQFPVAENYYREAISLPIYPGLTESQQDAVVSAFQKSLYSAPVSQKYAME